MTNDREKTIERVRKLMAMANDASSPNEAMIAARRARAMMDKFGLRLEDLEEGDGFGTFVLKSRKVKLERWKSWLACQVANLNDCVVRRDKGSIIFAGEETDAALAGSIFVYLVDTIERLAKAYQVTLIGTGQNLTKAGNDFKKGAVITINTRIKEIIAERTKQFETSGGTDLILIKKDLVAKHFNHEGYKTSKGTVSDATAYAEGRRQGNNISLNTQITGRDKQEALAS